MTLTKSLTWHKELQYKQRDFKSEYLFRTCSVTTNQVASLEFNPIRFAEMHSHLAEHGTVPYPLNSFFSAALRQAVIQATT